MTRNQATAIVIALLAIGTAGWATYAFGILALLALLTEPRRSPAAP